MSHARLTVVFAMLAACRGRADLKPLVGPFSDEAAYLRDCEDWPNPRLELSEVVAKRGPSRAVVSLVEVRESQAAASCRAMVKTKAGLFVGPSFLCAADRSDELVETDEARIDFDENGAELRFRVGYLLVSYFRGPEHRDPPPHHQDYAIRCALDGKRPACTDPPAIGGYGGAPCRRPSAP